MAGGGYFDDVWSNDWLAEWEETMRETAAATTRVANISLDKRVNGIVLIGAIIMEPKTCLLCTCSIVSVAHS